MTVKESNPNENQVVLDVLNSGPEPCCGNTALTEADSIRDHVQDFYAQRALNSDSCCGDASDNQLYEVEMLAALPDDVAGFSLGCGDPITLAELQPGEVVLDLGSGGGLDCFLASKQVGKDGHVIGIDMTPEMLERARSAARKMDFTNVEFREGYLEKMPVEDNSVDVVISNCVINLSPDKSQVFAEMLRTLEPGGRVSVSDIVTNGELPAALQKDMLAWGACVAGALDMDDYIAGLEGVGFEQVSLAAKADDGQLLDGIPQANVFSASITARKPIDS
ncbi:MAG: arsenite methyltransferase [Anaerolineales bacterium]|nr:arsenite methyltransferase [Anaerolineales bacterium]